MDLTEGICALRGRFPSYSPASHLAIAAAGHPPDSVVQSFRLLGFYETSTHGDYQRPVRRPIFPAVRVVRVHWAGRLAERGERAGLPVLTVGEVIAGVDIANSDQTEARRPATIAE